MKIEGIDFPRPLINAVRDRELVVFAGAGVSMGEPACLPSFVALADRVAAETGKSRKREEREAVDAFLGRLEQSGPDVHALAKRVLSGGDGKEPEPTELHRSLLRLFRNSEEVRLVTTNFDDLFEKAVPAVFDERPEVFHAPALPLGNDFTGLVHVHGSVREPERMVLTDGDFGRAYLTEGWARRFVVDLFQAKTVLFVGFSHEDVVLSYIARALPPASGIPQRFALVGSEMDEEARARWRRLGVELVQYPQGDDGGHDALPVGVRVLSNLVHRGVLDWRRVVHEVAASSPPVDQEANDELAFALERPENARFFTESAKSSEWVEWLHERGLLDGLFDHATYGEREALFERWLIWQFAAREPEVLLNLIAGRANRLAPAFWLRIVVWLSEAEDPPIDQRLVSVWVSLLLENAPRVELDGELHSLAKTCAKNSRWHDLAATFELCLVRRVGFPRYVAGVEAFWLEKTWAEQVRPNLEKVADQVLACSVTCFERRQHLLETWRPERKGRDWDVMGRLAIEPHEEDRQEDRRHAIDVAIDAARDALDWLAEHRGGDLGFWCGRLTRSRSTALRRLAVHGIVARADLSADERIDWLLTNTDLHELALRHEIFRAVRRLYSHASDERRKAVVGRILEFQGRSSGANRGQDAEHVEYEKFNWLVWLEDVAPSCPWVQTPLREIRQRHPDFGRRRDPDLAEGPVTPLAVEPRSPWSADEMLSQTPEEWVAALPADLPEEEYTPEGRLLDRAGGLALEIAKAVELQPSWGLGVADALLAAGRLDVPFWPGLVRELGADEGSVLGDVIALFGRPELQAAHPGPLAEVFRSAAAERESAWTRELLPNAIAAAVDLSDVARSVKLGAATEIRRRGWRHAGLNHPAASLATFWVCALDALRKDSGPSTRSAERTKVLEALSASFVVADSDSAAISVSVLAGQLSFLLAVEEEWTRENLLPLFAVETAGPGRSTLHEAVWDGFLVGGRLLPAVAEALEPAFLTVAESVGKFSDWKRGAFLDYAATMMVYYVDDPLAEWVPRLLRRLEESGKRELAMAIGRRLQQASPEVLLECWRRWLECYWQNRLDGVPASLAPVETEAMFYWLSSLEPVFPEAVDVAVRMPAVSGQRVPLQLSKLADCCAGAENVQALAKLALHLSDHDLGLDRGSRLRLIERLLGEDLPEETKRRLEAAAVKWGSDREVG